MTLDGKLPAAYGDGKMTPEQIGTAKVESEDLAWCGECVNAWEDGWMDGKIALFLTGS